MKVELLGIPKDSEDVDLAGARRSTHDKLIFIASEVDGDGRSRIETL